MRTTTNWVEWAVERDSDTLWYVEPDETRGCVLDFYRDGFMRSHVASLFKNNSGPVQEMHSRPSIFQATLSVSLRASLFGNSDANLTLSVAGGMRFDVTERLAVLGELRLRGIERDFSGSTSDFLGGLSWRW